MAGFGDSAAMYTIAQQMIITAQNYSLVLALTGQQLQPPNITPVFPSGPAAPAQSLAPLPEIQQISWAMPAAPPLFTGTITADDLLPEPFDETPPTLNFGNAPSPFTGTLPSPPSINTDYVYPSLSVTLPDAPTLMTLSTVTYDGYNAPTIDSTLPTLTAVEPSLVQYVPGANYTSTLLDQLRAALLDRIANGGTGLPPAVEQAIYDREREREYRAVADAVADLERMETLGYAFPPGAYLDARTKIQTEMGYTAASIGRDIMIKQAELEQKNILAAIEQANALEASYIRYINDIEQRAFEAAKYATQAGVEIYNAKVQAYAATVEAYKTKVEIYKGQIQGELAKVEAYKAEVQAESIKAEINKTLVEEYRIMLDAAMTNIKIYEAELDGIKTKATIEKLKIDIFGEEVKAYAASINAYTGQVEAYKATIQAEATKQEAYKTQVEAYTATVQAAVAEIQARIAAFKGNLDANLAQWEGYKAAVAAETSKAQAIAANNQSLTDSYRAQVAGLSSYNETLTKQWQVVIDQNQRVSEIGVSAAKANSDAYISTRSLAMEAAKVGAQVSAQLGAAALNAINYSTSYNESKSESTSQSYSESFISQEINSTSASV